jgi:Coenzyme PQQ synthesis protein D (PqqD)
VSELYIARGERLAARKVAGEMVILGADDSSLYVLNEIGTAVWDAADGRRSVQAIVDDVICGEYDVDRETALRDVTDFVEALSVHGVLRTSGRAIVMEGGEEAATSGVS